VGYDITFTLEADEEFIPAIPPLEIDPNEQDDYGNVAEDKTGNNGVRSLSKKHNSEPKQNEHNASSSGPAPMQIAEHLSLKLLLQQKLVLQKSAEYNRGKLNTSPFPAAKSTSFLAPSKVGFPTMDQAASLYSVATHKPVQVLSPQ